MDDLISRQAAIEAIKEIRDKIWDVDIPSPTVPEYIEHHQQMIHLMDECDNKLHELYLLPSAQPEQRWIPCNERLPEARRSVILSTKNWTGEGCYWETTAHHVVWKGYRWNATYWDDEVIAWMPLPEPYKEGADE